MRNLEVVDYDNLATKDEINVTYSVTCIQPFYRLPSDFLTKKDPFWDPDDDFIEDNAIDGDENDDGEGNKSSTDFWKLQTLTCIKDPTTGNPVWNFNELVACETRTCMIIEEMKASQAASLSMTKFSGFEWSIIWQTGIAGKDLPAEVSVYSRLRYNCPNKEEIWTKCDGDSDTYYAPWDLICSSVLHNNVIFRKMIEYINLFMIIFRIVQAVVRSRSPSNV